MSLRHRFIALTCLAGLALAPAAHAQADYPSRPLRMVVGFPPGGISDVLARAVAAEAANALGQSIVVENRPGAGTTIASDVVARADPDGYTVLFQDVTTHAINASLYSKLNFDSIKSFTPIALVSSSPLMLVVNPASKVQTVDQLVARLKAKPGVYSYGSSGNGTIIHLAGEMFLEGAGAQAMHIPYKGSAGLTTAIMSGEIEYAFSSMPPAVSQVAAGKLVGLAVTTPKRVAIAPDMPTIAEAGRPEAEVVLYSGVMGPAGMPAGIVDRLNAAFAKAVASESVRKTFRGLGAEAMTETPAAFAQLLQGETQRYRKMVQDVGVQVN